VKPKLLAVVVALVVLSAPAALGGTASVAYPGSMAALGDSITRGFDTCSFPYVDCPANSWSTGTNAAVQSQYLRILAQNPSISGHAYNDAKTGATMSDLAGQAATAVSQHVDYVTILMGANDVCTSSVSTMTPVATVGTQLAAALTTLTSGLPNARIFVASIPNVYNLWSILHTNLAADTVWGFAKICQSLLAKPLSTASADQQRRQAVYQRTVDDNAAIQSVCAQYPQCRYDGGATFGIAFTPSDVTTRDYFHPTVSGQAKEAAVTWAATYAFGP